MKKALKGRWDIALIALFVLGTALLFIVSGQQAHLAVADNLELFQAQYKMLRDTGTFFTANAQAPFLGGISRGVLPSEFSLPGILYFLFPPLTAYLIHYYLRILISILSFHLLYRELRGRLLLGAEEIMTHREAMLVTLAGFAYGICSLFPAFGSSFTSIPLLIYLMLRQVRKGGWKWPLLIFLYPLLSYFSYFGLFLLAYLAVAFIILFLRAACVARRERLRLLIGMLALAAGYVAFEHRLFAQMLFSDEVTIRSTMKIASLPLGEAVRWMADSFVNGMMHAEGSQKYLVLPVCLIYFVWQNVQYLRQKEATRILHDLYNLVMLILVFNSVIYGLYYYEPFRSLVERLVPPLTGWQFGRTIFFSPFLWYAAILIVCVRMATRTEALQKTRICSVVPVVMLIATIGIEILAPTQYNDVRETAFARAYELRTGRRTNNLSYGEFYSEDLFRLAKEEIGYEGEWSAAYGFYPAVLEYNGIATLDGYLGFYSQEYKDHFREVIAPALETNEDAREYYDNWGARCYLYSGDGEIVTQALRTYEVEDHSLQIDPAAFRALGGRYLFSRLEVSNAEQLGIALRGVFTDEASPYTLYVYDAAQESGE